MFLCFVTYAPILHAENRVKESLQGYASLKSSLCVHMSLLGPHVNSPLLSIKAIICCVLALRVFGARINRIARQLRLLELDVRTQGPVDAY